MALSPEVASAVAIWVEVLLYGVYSCLFFESMYIMLKKRSANAASAKIFLTSTILMYLLATAHIVVNLYRLLRVFVLRVDPNGATDYLYDFSRWDTVAHNCMLCIMTWLGDGLVIYRCFIIWNNNYYIIIIPLILLSLSVFINAVLLWWFTHPGLVTFDQTIPWMNTIYPFAFVQNVLTTGMIALKIWKQHRASSSSGVVDSTSRLSLINILRIIVESAAVYTVQLMILIILYPMRHNAQFIVQSAIIPSIGIVFVLIAVRVHFSKSRTLFTAASSAIGMPSWLDDTESQQSIPESVSRTEGAYQLREEKFKARSLSRLAMASPRSNLPGQGPSNSQ